MSPFSIQIKLGGITNKTFLNVNKHLTRYQNVLKCKQTADMIHVYVYLGSTSDAISVT